MTIKNYIKKITYLFKSPEELARIAWKTIKKEIDEYVQYLINNGDEPHNLQVYLEANLGAVYYFYENRPHGEFIFAEMLEVPDSKNKADLDAFHAELMQLFAETYTMPRNNGVMYIVK